MEFNSLIMLVLAVVVVLSLSNQNYYGVEGRKSLTKEEDLELERQLKILNKPPIKTFQTELGDIFDCIDIYKQPAFDHPLLKDHKIQMEPSFLQEKRIRNGAASSITKASKTEHEFNNESCPKGTVPIMRATKEHLLNAKYFLKQQNRSSDATNTYPSHHFVSLQPSAEGKEYLGAAAHISIQVPNKVEADQFVTSQISMQNGPAEEINSIEMGWTIYPKLFGDTKARIFSYWTADGYKNTGCFNVLCSGFVQIHPTIALGSSVDKAMFFESEGDQFVQDAAIERDAITGNWLLILGDPTYIGYWPKELFTHLATNATVVRYGGIAGAEANRPTPPLGLGEIPDQDITKVSYMSHLKVRDETGLGDFDVSKTQLNQDTTEDCYKIIFRGYISLPMGLGVMFGGPGGMCHQ